MNLSKLAFRPSENASYAGAIRVAQNEECNQVYLIGENSEWLAALRAAGLTVHQVQSKEELPADVFHFYRHKGFWATVHTASGVMRNVGWAEDSVMAAKTLARNYTEEFREQFHVHPVDIKLLDLGW
jgi:hypothetical protein